MQFIDFFLFKKIKQEKQSHSTGRKLKSKEQVGETAEHWPDRVYMT